MKKKEDPTGGTPIPEEKDIIAVKNEIVSCMRRTYKIIAGTVKAPYEILTDILDLQREIEYRAVSMHEIEENNFGNLPLLINSHVGVSNPAQTMNEDYSRSAPQLGYDIPFDQYDSFQSCESNSDGEQIDEPVPEVVTSSSGMKDMILKEFQVQEADELILLQACFVRENIQVNIVRTTRDIRQCRLSGHQLEINAMNGYPLIYSLTLADFDLPARVREAQLDQAKRSSKSSVNTMASESKYFVHKMEKTAHEDGMLADFHLTLANEDESDDVEHTYDFSWVIHFSHAQVMHEYLETKLGSPGEFVEDIPDQDVEFAYVLVDDYMGDGPVVVIVTTGGIIIGYQPQSDRQPMPFCFPNLLTQDSESRPKAGRSGLIWDSRTILVLTLIEPEETMQPAAN